MVGITDKSYQISYKSRKYTIDSFLKNTPAQKKQKKVNHRTNHKTNNLILRHCRSRATNDQIASSEQETTQIACQHKSIIWAT